MTSYSYLFRAAAVAGVAISAATAVLTGTAFAMPTDKGQCNASDVTAKVIDRGVGAGTHSYTLTLASRTGKSCQVGGSPQQTQFLSANGRIAPVTTSSANPGSWPQVTVDGNHSAQIDIQTATSPGVPVSSLRFNVPSGGENTIAVIPWTPGSIASGARFGTARSVVRAPN